MFESDGHGAEGVAADSSGRGSASEHDRVRRWEEALTSLRSGAVASHDLAFFHSLRGLHEADREGPSTNRPRQTLDYNAWLSDLHATLDSTGNNPLNLLDIIYAGASAYPSDWFTASKIEVAVAAVSAWRPATGELESLDDVDLLSAKLVAIANEASSAIFVELLALVAWVLERRFALLLLELDATDRASLWQTLGAEAHVEVGRLGAACMYLHECSTRRGERLRPALGSFARTLTIFYSALLDQHSGWFNGTDEYLPDSTRAAMATFRYSEAGADPNWLIGGHSILQSTEEPEVAMVLDAWLDAAVRVQLFQANSVLSDGFSDLVQLALTETHNFRERWCALLLASQALEAGPAEHDSSRPSESQDHAALSQERLASICTALVAQVAMQADEQLAEWLAWSANVGELALTIDRALGYPLAWDALVDAVVAAPHYFDLLATPHPNGPLRVKLDTIVEAGSANADSSRSIVSVAQLCADLEVSQFEAFETPLELHPTSAWFVASNSPPDGWLRFSSPGISSIVRLLEATQARGHRLSGVVATELCTRWMSRNPEASPAEQRWIGDALCRLRTAA